MTPEKAAANFDAAQRRFGDVVFDPDSTEHDYVLAKEALSQAEKVMRGTPRTLSGIRRTP